MSTTEITVEGRTSTFHLAEREGWGLGPWEGEPDLIVGTASGLRAALVRGPVGAWCGYVGVPRGHVLYGREYRWMPGRDIVPPVLLADDDRGAEDFGSINLLLCAWRRGRRDLATLIRVHGGLSWSRIGRDHSNLKSVGPDLWWIGFDCAHAGDLTPGMRDFLHGEYRDVSYVREQVERLAHQVALFDLHRRERAQRRQREGRLAWARSFVNGRRGP